MEFRQYQFDIKFKKKVSEDYFKAFLNETFGGLTEKIHWLDYKGTLRNWTITVEMSPSAAPIVLDRFEIQGIDSSIFRIRDKEKDIKKQLSLTIDPEKISKNEVLELLQALNSLYQAIGGDKLVIKEDQIGVYKKLPKNELV